MIKNMLTHRYIALVGSFILMAGACTDLEESTFSEVAAEGFGQTDDEFAALLVGGYTQLYGLLGNHNSYWSLQEVSTDEMVIPTRGADWGDGGQWTRVHTHQYNPAEESVNNAWVKLYGAIATTNQLIAQLPELNAERAAPFLAELRTLRAMYYWYLMDLYGNVPIVTRFGDSNPVATAPRREVYDFVVGELEAIIPDLDNVSIYARVSRPVAQALLAKVYLNAEVYTGESRYAEALALCNEIIDSGLYSLESDYFTNFNVDNSASQENIFVIPYDELFGTGFNLGQMTLHYGSQQTFNSQSQPWNGYATLQEFYESYDEDDLRRGVPGDQRVRGNFLAGPQFTADGDPVLDASADDADGQELNFTPEINELLPGAQRQAGARVAKFEYEQGFLPELSNDFPIFRLADIMLMKAECLMRTSGDGDEALELVNMVRARAEAQAFDELSMDNLLDERGREMFAEGYRRQDLIRFDRYGDTWWEKPESDETKELMPIPAAQLQANPNLVQNPGY